MEHSIIDFIMYNNEETGQKLQADRKYKKISEKRYEIYLQLYEMLTKEQKEVFDTFENLGTDELCRTSEIYFKEGVKVGIRLVAESMFN